MLDTSQPSAADIAGITRDPLFKELVASRSSFAWLLSAIILVVYLGFIILVAFARGAMAASVGGGTISVGIVLGFAIIIFAFALTGVYVSRANGRFDALTRELKGRFSK